VQQLPAVREVDHRMRVRVDEAPDVAPGRGRDDGLGRDVPDRHVVDLDRRPLARRDEDDVDRFDLCAAGTIERSKVTRPILSPVGTGLTPSSSFDVVTRRIVDPPARERARIESQRADCRKAGDAVLPPRPERRKQTPSSPLTEGAVSNGTFQ
jgi:hypothetical protein